MVKANGLGGSSVASFVQANQLSARDRRGYLGGAENHKLLERYWCVGSEIRLTR